MVHTLDNSVTLLVATPSLTRRVKHSCPNTNAPYQQELVMTRVGIQIVLRILKRNIYELTSASKA